MHAAPTREYQEQTTGKQLTGSRRQHYLGIGDLAISRTLLIRRLGFCFRFVVCVFIAEIIAVEFGTAQQRLKCNQMGDRREMFQL